MTSGPAAPAIVEPTPAVAIPLWQPGQRAVLAVGIGALGGCLMALAMAAVTGWGLVRLLRVQARTDAPAEPAPESRR
jgi:hypothetical protein